MDWLRVFPVIGKLWNWWRSRIGLSREHDVALFRKIDGIANESRISDILNGMHTGDHAMEYDRVVVDFINALQRIENQYIDPVIRLRASELAWDMGKLLDMVRQTFWKTQSGRLKFYPDPIDKKVFDAEWKELNKKLDTAWEAYKAYRQAVKDRLIV